MRFNRVFPDNDIHRNRVLADPDFWRARLEIYKRTTRPSLLNQTDKDFEIWAVFNTEQLATYPHVMNFAACMSQFPEVRLVFENHNPTKSFVPIAEACNQRYETYDNVILINLDCDDMYHAEVIERYKKIKPVAGMSIVMDKGYLYDINSERFAHYAGNGAPGPFWGLVFPREYRSNVNTMFEYMNKFRMNGQHFQMHEAKNGVMFANGMYVQVIHGANTTTDWENYHTQKHTGNEFESKPTIKKILKNFGL